MGWGREEQWAEMGFRGFPLKQHPSRIPSHLGLALSVWPGALPGRMAESLI